MKIKKALPTIILVCGLALLLVGNARAVYNQRINPNADQEPVVSRLKDMPTEGLETAEDVPELVTQQILPPLDDTSREVTTGDAITVNYRGWLASNGTIFDQSFNRGDDGFTFTVGQGVIEGWSQGVIGMRLGEIRRLKIPSALGYGELGSGEQIPPDSDLIFDVELLSIN